MLTVAFTRERDTKRTVRYTEVATDDAEPVIGTLYVQKSGLAKLGFPSRLAVVIGTPDEFEAADE